MNKEKDSLRKNKLGKASVALGLTVVTGVSLSSTDVFAENLPSTDSSAPKVVSNEATTKVTDKEVLDAKALSDGSRGKLEDVKSQVSKATTEKDALLSEGESLLKEKSRLDGVSKLDEAVLNNNVKNAESKVKDIERIVSESEAKVKDDEEALGKQKDVLSEKEQAKVSKQKEVDSAEAEVAASKKVLDGYGESNLILDKAKKEKELNDTNKVLHDKNARSKALEAEIESSKKEDAERATKLIDAKAEQDAKKTELDAKNKELSDAKIEADRAQKDLDAHNKKETKWLTSLELPKDYIAKDNPTAVRRAIAKKVGYLYPHEVVKYNDVTKKWEFDGKEYDYESWANSAVLERNRKTLYGDTGQTAQYAYETETRAIFKSKEYASRESKYYNYLVDQQNAYTAKEYNSFKDVKEADKVIDINNMSQEDLEEVTFIATRIVNSFREQLGKKPIKPSGFLTEFAKKVGQKRVEANIEETRHYARGIDAVAKEYGMWWGSDDTPEDATSQIYELLYPFGHRGNMSKAELLNRVTERIYAFMLEAKVNNGNMGHYDGLMGSGEYGAVGLSKIGDKIFFGYYMTKEHWFEKNEAGRASRERIKNTVLQPKSEEEGNRLRDVLSSAKSKLDKALSEQKKADDAYKVASGKVAELEKGVSKVPGLLRERDSLNNEVKVLSDNVTKLGSEISALEKAIDAFSADVKKSQKAYDDAVSKLNEKKKELMSAEVLVGQEKGKLDDISKKLETSKGALSLAKASKEKVSLELTHAKDALDEFLNVGDKIAENDKKILENETKRKDVEAKLEKLNESLKEAELEFEKASKVYSDLLARYTLENKVEPWVEPALPEFTGELPPLATDEIKPPLEVGFDPKGDEPGGDLRDATTRCVREDVPNVQPVGKWVEKKSLPNTDVSGNGAAGMMVGGVALLMVAVLRRKVK